MVNSAHANYNYTHQQMAQLFNTTVQYQYATQQLQVLSGLSRTHSAACSFWGKCGDIAGYSKVARIWHWSTSGRLTGNAVVDALRQWTGVPEYLAGFCFDITRANTGVHTGAITVIQKAFDKQLLFLACRHHILEIEASAVFDLFFASSGPNIPIFGRFKEQ